MTRQHEREHERGQDHEPEHRPPTVAERNFAERAGEYAGLDLTGRFTRLYETNLWDGAESRLSM